MRYSCGPAPANRPRLVSSDSARVPDTSLTHTTYVLHNSIMSSDSEFYQEPDYENISRNIIAEVKKRPALYDQSLTEYNKHDRKRLWQDVYRSIFKDWDNFTENQKTIEGEMVQKKWKNIKDSFLKELAYLKGKPHKKKRKYIHYDSLLFLLPTLQQKKGKIWTKKGTGTTHPAPNSRLTRSSHEDSTSTLRDRNSSLNSTEHKLDKEEDIDEEKHFALMLVPMLRKLDENQKHYAKIEILNILHRARSNTVAWPVENVSMMEPQPQLSVVYRNRRDPIAPARTATNATDVEAGELIKNELEIEDMTEEND